MRQRLIISAGIAFFILTTFVNWKSQDLPQPDSCARIKESFDYNWQFHKGDIAIKLVVRVGQGGITDINVPVITRKDTVIDYTDVRSSTSFNPGDWNEVNLPARLGC